MVLTARLIANDDKNKLLSCTSIQRKTNFPTVSTPALHPSPVTDSTSR